MKVSLRGTGPAVLLLHGLPTSGRLWDYVVPMLQRKFTCVVVDLPGAGQSLPPADGSMDPDHYAQELENLRRQLSIPFWHIVGHDAGSVIAIHYASRFGERMNRLVLCSAPIFPDFRVPWFFRLIRTPVVGDCLAPIWTLVLWRLVIWKIEQRNPSTAGIMRSFRQPYTGYAGTRRFVHLLRWGDPAQVMAKTASLLPSVAAPTLILHGKKERVIPASFAARAAALILNSEVRLMDCGHFSPLDCPDVLCGYLLSFLQRSS
jgi:pimeloyl-ACP methyl ester carboxylesterase